MGHEIYRTSDAPAPVPEPAREELRLAEEFVTPALFLLLGGLLVALGVAGGRAHATEGGLGVLALLFATWSFFQAIEATGRDTAGRR